MSHEWVVEGSLCRYGPLNGLMFVVTWTSPLGKICGKKRMVGDDLSRRLEIFILVHESKSTTIEVCRSKLKGGDELEHFLT